MTFYFSVEKPYHYVMVNKNGKVQSDGTVEALSELTEHAVKHNVVGVASGEMISLCRFKSAIKSRQKLSKALPFVLEEDIIGDIETQHFVLSKFHSKQNAEALVVDKVKLNGWLEICAEANLRIDHLIPDYALLPDNLEAAISIVKANGDKIYVLGKELNTHVLEADEFAVLWRDLADKTVSVAVNDPELKQFIEHNNAAKVLNWHPGNNWQSWAEARQVNWHDYDLLQGNFLPQHRKNRTGGFKLAVCITLLALCIKVGSDGYEYWLYNKENIALEQNITQLFKKTFPDVKRIVNPKAQTEQKIAELNIGGNQNNEFQNLLSVVAKSIPAARGEVQEISFRDNTLTFVCSLSDFSQLERLKKLLSRDQDIVVELLSSGANENRVTGRFRLQRKSSI